MKKLPVLMAACVVSASFAQNIDVGEQSNRFRAATNLSAKQALSTDLMRTGGDEAFREFKRALLDTNATRTLNLNEEACMLSFVGSMGYLAVTSNIARDFLIEATQPQFWKTNISWKTKLGESENLVLASYALVALAVSGRPEFDAVAAKLKQDLITERRDYLPSALVDAHFRKHLVETKGWESYLKNDMDEVMKTFREWKKTPSGSNWVQWGRTVELPEK